MLDQNTDRMWFVIGAVIVGAAIIFIANGTLPEIFASVTDSFENVSDEAINRISKFDDGNLFIPYTAVKGEYVREQNGDTQVHSTGDDARSQYIQIQAGESYTFKFPNDVQNSRIAFYDENYNFIEGSISYKNIHEPHDEILGVAPSNALYARISSKYKGSQMHSPIDTWWFGLTSDLIEGSD